VIFESVASGGCRSYLVGCADTCGAVVIDPEITQLDRYLGLAARHGLQIRYLIDTHTHADHFSAAAELARRMSVPVVMHRASPAPFVGIRVEGGELIGIGRLRLNVVHTPGHTADSMCLVVEDRVFTGDTLLMGATGRTDLPSGDPEALYDSLFERLQSSDRRTFVDMMRNLNLSAPTHLTEALRINMSGGKSIAQLLAAAALKVPFMSLADLRNCVQVRDPDLIILDVREREAFERAHLPGARHLPRGQLELRVNEELPDPTRRVLVYCELGQISTLAAATLREVGYQRAVALDGGMRAWREAGYPVEGSASVAG
jgi:rhodanese-related sulfurtransferase